jgi:hypothetical protein
MQSNQLTEIKTPRRSRGAKVKAQHRESRARKQAAFLSIIVDDGRRIHQMNSVPWMRTINVSARSNCKSVSQSFISRWEIIRLEKKSHGSNIAKPPIKPSKRKNPMLTKFRICDTYLMADAVLQSSNNPPQRLRTLSYRPSASAAIGHPA